MYKLLIRPLLFCFDPEKVHYFTFSIIRFLSKIPLFSTICRSIYEVKDKRLEKEVFGLKHIIPNKIESAIRSGTYTAKGQV